MTVFQYSTGSVYFGVEYLDMRSRSSNNFSPEDLRKIVEILKKQKTTSLVGQNAISKTAPAAYITPVSECF